MNYETKESIVNGKFHSCTVTIFDRELAKAIKPPRSVTFEEFGFWMYNGKEYVYVGVDVYLGRVEFRCYICPIFFEQIEREVYGMGYAIQELGWEAFYVPLEPTI